MGRTGLSKKELSRVEVMGRVKGKSLWVCEAAELLEVSYRQAKRIWARYRDGGAKALQHGNCGRVSNRAYAAKLTGQMTAVAVPLRFQTAPLPKFTAKLPLARVMQKKREAALPVFQPARSFTSFEALRLPGLRPASSHQIESALMSCCHHRSS